MSPMAIPLRSRGGQEHRADGLRDPHTFDIRRDPNLHPGFGGTGAHRIGAHLARTEQT
jgi:cytochrome P450